RRPGRGGHLHQNTCRQLPSPVSCRTFANSSRKGTLRCSGRVMGFKIFVGNLSYEATEDELRELFTAYGAVDSVRIKKDRKTGKPGGFAFAEMPREGDCKTAVKAMDGSRHQTRTLRVSVAEPQQPGGGGPRGPGGPSRGPG